MSMISKTKLYDSLRDKLGKETADDLITYYEDKIDNDLESKLSICATKEDLAKGLANLESKINESRIETKDEFAKVESKISELRSATKDTLSAIREDFTKCFANLESKMSEWRTETNEGITKLESKFETKINESEKKMTEKIHEFKIETVAKLGQFKVNTLVWIVSLVFSVAGLLFSILKK